MAVKTVVVAEISREYVRIPTTVFADGALIDPTNPEVPLSWAVVVEGAEPAEEDFIIGLSRWETTADGKFLACVLVGDASADHQIVKGTTYDGWLRVADSPERPTKLVVKILAV